MFCKELSRVTPLHGSQYHETTNAATMAEKRKRSFEEKRQVFSVSFCALLFNLFTS